MKSSRVFLVSGFVLFALIYLMSRGDNRGESIGTLRIFGKIVAFQRQFTLFLSG